MQQPGMQQPGVESEPPDSGRPVPPPALWRRKPTLRKVGLVCFVLGLPLVGLSDGAILSVVGLLLELLAGTCLILLVFAVIDEGHERDEETRGQE